MPRTPTGTASRAKSRKDEGRVGRPPKDGELAEIRKEVLFEPSEWEEWMIAFKELAPGAKFPGTQMRDVLMNWARGELVERAPFEKLLQAGFESKMAALGTDAFRAPYLSRVPCGPWREALASGETFAVSREVARELEAQPGDIWVRADGQSMEGAGIADGVMVLVRPYENKPPRRGDIVVLQATTESGEIVGTLKRYAGSDGNVPNLLDGNEEPFALPQNTVKIETIARALGVLGRL